MPTPILPPFPDIERVAEETSGREANLMLKAGWRLLLVVGIQDGAGGYPCYVLGKPRTVPPPVAPAPVAVQ